MKWLVQAIVLIVLGVVTAWVGYGVVGEPERGVKCDPQQLESGEVCLETVQQEWKGEVIWVDARSEKEWKAKRVAGAIFVAESDMDRFLSEPATMQQIGMAGVEGKRLVVYCATDACGSSKAVAERIRESGLHDHVYALRGGWKAILSAGDQVTLESGE